MHRRFKIKLLVVQLASILPFLLFIFYLFDLWYDTRRELVFEQNINVAKLVAMSINDSIKTGLSVTASLSTDILMKDNLRNTLEDIPEIIAVQMTDANGQILASTLALTSGQEKISLSDKPYFQQALKDKKVVVSNPTIDSFTKKNVVMVASPILKNDQVTGVAIASLDLVSLKNKVEKALAGRNKKTIILLDRDGQIAFAIHRELPSETEKNLLSDYPFVRQAKEKELVLIENQWLPFLDKPMVGASVSIDGLDWTVVSLQPVEVVYAPLFKIQSVVWLIIFSALLFSVTLISYFLRRVRIIF